MRVVDLGRVTVQQSIPCKLSVHGDGKGEILLVRIPVRDGAKKTTSRILHRPQKRPIDTEEVEKLIAAAVPEAHDGVDVPGSERTQLRETNFSSTARLPSMPSQPTRDLATVFIVGWPTHFAQMRLFDHDNHRMETQPERDA